MRCLVAAISVVTLGCPGETTHGEVAEGVSGPLGSIVPFATAEQRETFERGREVAELRFDLADGLGPAFNVTFCASCHEKPVTGGSAGLYRNFFLSGFRTPAGVFFPGESAGMAGGVIRMYRYEEGETAHPLVPDTTTIFAQRNPIPFFGVGLLAEIDGEEILKRADPEDEDEDGISGRANFEMGFVGRFGRKAQTASIEGFIRGPLFNHLGVTTNPLTDEERARLPVDSSSRITDQTTRGLRPAQAAVGDEPTLDDDGVADPELSPSDLFDLISFSMLLAAPELEPLSEPAKRGLELFDELGCADCHTPRLESPRGPLPVYSDLLLHDMGDSMADGIEQKEASGSEFRTQPLWGLSAVGPYLHDGRADTIEDAILMHDGEGLAARDRFEGLSDEERADVVTFLESLGGRTQRSDGLLPPDDVVPAVGAFGGPRRPLDEAETELFAEGRRLFDNEFFRRDGLGGPRLNGDSCRACHFDPVIGGAGPRGVNVMRHGLLTEDGRFVPPAVGTILHKTTILANHGTVAQPESQVFEARQTPHLFGLGLIDEIPEEVILQNVDPDDTRNPDGISGRASRTDDGRLGRFGWKAQVPTVAEFVRDALSAELGLTLPYVEGLTFGAIHDNDDVADPEIDLDRIAELEFFLMEMAPPPRDGEQPEGERLFDAVGCTGCHIPELAGVPLYSDLLLHEILPPDAMGIEDTSANVREFRTPPLWGLRATAPYLHSGRADTLEQAINLHDGEAVGARTRFSELTAEERIALLAFLETL